MDDLNCIDLFLDWCKDQIKAHPSLKVQIIESYELAATESLDGSESHEIELAMDHIEQLIEGL